MTAPQARVTAMAEEGTQAPEKHHDLASTNIHMPAPQQLARATKPEQTSEIDGQSTV